MDIGTRWSLYFPRHFISSIDELPIIDIATIDTSGDENILLVDDEPALLGLIKEVLEQQGYNVMCAQSGKQALEILATEPSAYCFPMSSCLR